VDARRVERADLADARPAALEGAAALLRRGRARAQPGYEMRRAERAGGGHQAQRGASVEARAGQLLAAQAEQRIARIEVVGVLQLARDLRLLPLGQDEAVPQHAGLPVRWRSACPQA